MDNERVLRLLSDIAGSEHFLRHPQAFGEVVARCGLKLVTDDGPFRVVDPEAPVLADAEPSPEEVNRAAELDAEAAKEAERVAAGNAEREAIAEKRKKLEAEAAQAERLEKRTPARKR